MEPIYESCISVVSAVYEFEEKDLQDITKVVCEMTEPLINGDKGCKVLHFSLTEGEDYWLRLLPDSDIKIGSTIDPRSLINVNLMEPGIISCAGIEKSKNPKVGDVYHICDEVGTVSCKLSGVEVRERWNTQTLKC